MVLSDLRYALRMLGKNPGFTATVVVLLALGIGANTAVFSVVNAVLLRPLPYRAADRIYSLEGRTKIGMQWISAPDFLTWRDHTQAFEAMAAASHERYVVTGAVLTEEVTGLAATRELLPMLGVAPALGRSFGADDYRDGAPRTALIGYRLWQRQFGGDRRAVGRTLVLNGAPHTVVGVMPAEFQFPDPLSQIWTPMTFSARALSRREWPAFMVWARAKAGVSKEQPEREARFIAGVISRDFPATSRREGWGLAAVPFQENSIKTVRRTLLVLLGAVAFVLLIACLNVASMLLARATQRAREMAIRASLGAGRARLVRQLLTESMLLSACGALLGLGLAALGKRALLALYELSARVPLPRAEQSRIDGQVLAFTLLVSLACAAIFGLAPALAASRVNLVERLKEGGYSAARTGRFWSRGLLIVAETALSLVLLAGAGLMIRTVAGYMRVNPGFNPDRVLTMRLPLPTFRIPDRKKQPAYYNGILQQIQSLPGVQSAALVSAVPLSGWSVNLSFEPPLVTGKGEKREVVAFRAVSSDYFRVMGIPILTGRAFAESDTSQSQNVVMVNEQMAREFWPGENVVGKTIPLHGNSAIIGVAGNVKHLSLADPPEAELYEPFLQGIGVGQSVLVLRTAAEDPSSMLGAVQRKIRQASADQPIQEPATARRLISDSFSEPRFYMLLLTVFAGLGVALASVGIFGVTSFSVSRREHEFGIRMAVGASPGEVMKSVLQRGALYAAIGIAAGVGGALAATRLIRTMLFGVKPADGLTYAAVSAILFAIALAACYIPARRASRVDPMTALRHD